jgi:cytochrome b561
MRTLLLPVRRAPLANTPLRYGLVAIVLHWAMAGLLAVMLALGFYMVSLPDVGFDQVKITLILVHKSLGVLALVLLLLRLAWRVGNVLPRLVAGMADWQQVAARFVHLAFYGVVLALPFTGWLMSSAGGYPVPVFGLFELPDLIPPNDARFHFFIALHGALAYVLLGLVVVHTAAALWHWLLLRDGTLERMWP